MIMSLKIQMDICKVETWNAIRKSRKHWLTVALLNINVTCHIEVVDFVLGLTIQCYGPLGGNVAP